MTLTIYNAEDIPQGSDAWLEARRGIVTASTVGKLLTSTGKIANNDTSRALTETLIAERITGRVEYVHPTRDMQRGTILEPYARDLYAEHYAPVREVGFGRLDTDTFTLGASPDGLVDDDREGPGGIEVKSPRARTHLLTLTEDRVPPHYMPQIQACMYVFGRAWWDFISYCPGLPLYIYRVDADDRWQNAIEMACEAFTDSADKSFADYHEILDAKNYHPTEYFDPFAEEDIIIG